MAYLGVQPLKGQNRTIDNISASFNGANVTFNLASGGLSLTPATAYQLFISVGNVLQGPGVDFTVNGNQITFTTAPAAGLTFWGLYQGDAIDSVSVSDSSITTAKLATGLTVTLGAGSASTPSLTFAGDTNTGTFSPGADIWGITTNGTERWRINSVGQVFQYTNQYNFSSSASTIEFVNRDGSGAKTFQWYVGASGTAPVATLSTAGVWTNASDARYKENIQDILYGIDTVKQLKPRSFDIISTGDSAIGFVAQELKENVPEVVHEVPAHDGETYLNVDYGSLTAVLTKALQEAVSRIEVLEGKLAAQEGA